MAVMHHEGRILQRHTAHVTQPVTQLKLISILVSYFVYFTITLYEDFPSLNQAKLQIIG